MSNEKKENESMLRMIKEAQKKLAIEAEKKANGQQRFDKSSIAKEESYLEGKTKEAKKGHSEVFSYQGHHNLKPAIPEDSKDLDETKDIDSEYEYHEVQKNNEKNDNENTLKEENEVSLEASDDELDNDITNKNKEKNDVDMHDVEKIKNLSLLGLSVEETKKPVIKKTIPKENSGNEDINNKLYLNKKSYSQSA